MGRAWTWLGVILVILGALLLTSPITTLILTRTPASTATNGATVEDTRMLQTARTYDRRLLDTPSAYVGEAVDPFTGTDGTPAWRTDADYLSQLGAGDDMARIRIPGIGVDLPIGHGTSAGVLENGAGHVYGTTLPIGDEGNTVIAAHRGLGMRLLFYRLGELHAGSLVYTEAAGRTVAWHVDSLTRVQPGSTRERRMLDVTRGRTLLTLYTCDPPGLNTRRLIIRAHRIPYTGGVPARGTGDWMPAVTAIGVVTAATLLLMAVFHPTVPVMRHATRRVARPPYGRRAR